MDKDSFGINVEEVRDMLQYIVERIDAGEFFARDFNHEIDRHDDEYTQHYLRLSYHILRKS